MLQKIEPLIIFAGYLIMTYFLVQKEVKENFKGINQKISDHYVHFDRRADKNEYYLRRLEALMDLHHPQSLNRSKIDLTSIDAPDDKDGRQ